MGVFAKVLKEMKGGSVMDPRPFQVYAKSSGHPQVDTASQISIQSLDGLSSELKSEEVMVFRLGRSGTARGTDFALAKCFNGWSDYFLVDEDLYKSVEVEDFDMESKMRSLSIFPLLPNYTESSLVMLALSTGILAKALSLDDGDSPLISATENGTHSFSVRPHTELQDEWLHNEGQVEIDGLFIGERRGISTLFVLEAKVSGALSTLSKCKLAYPMLALREKAPKGMPMVGVYLRVVKNNETLAFYVAECDFVSPKNEISSLSGEACGVFKIPALWGT